ncbi:MAG: RHS repeat-associated core domain-containing protein [Flavobacteriales bacterium]
MRLTYSIPCVDGTQVPTLLHAADYYPYGSILRQHINGAQEKYLTTHHERDLETGLDYRGARYYDSDVARFLSLDPLAADYASWSPYNYVAGNPISKVDPDGKSWWDVVAGGAMAVAQNMGVSPVVIVAAHVALAPHISSASDFQRGQHYGHVTSLVAGTMMEVDGALNVAIGLSATGGAGGALAVTGGGAAPVLGPVAAGGAIVAAGGAVEGAYGAYVAGNARQNLMAGRSSNHRKPDAGENKSQHGPAEADHSVINARGNTTYTRNDNNPSGWQEVKRTDVQGKPHRNPDGTYVPTPHTKVAGEKKVTPAEKRKDY